MKIGKVILQALLGVLIAAGLTVLVSALSPTQEPGTLPLTARGIGAGISVLAGMGFAGGWIAAARRRRGENSAGTVVNGIGFGLLPALALWKGFEGGRGITVPEGWPGIPWVAEDGLFLPARAETILLLAVFGSIAMWIALRRKPMPGNGDLLPVAGTAAATVTLLTRGFAGEGAWLAAAALIMAVCLIYWTCRIFRQKENTGYAFACVPVWIVMMVVIALQHFGILVVNPWADAAIRSFCVLIAVKAVLCAGRVSRRED